MEEGDRKMSYTPDDIIALGQTGVSARQQIVKMDVDELEVHPYNVRKLFVTNNEDFSDLVKDIAAHGVIEPLWVVEPNKVIVGQRRLKAVRELVYTQGREDLRKIDCRMLKNDRPEDKWIEISIIAESFHKDVHSNDMSVAYDYMLKKICKGDIKKMAKRLGKSITSIKKYIKAGDMSDEAMKCFKKGKKTVATVEAADIPTVQSPNKKGNVVQKDDDFSDSPLLNIEDKEKKDKLEIKITGGDTVRRKSTINEILDLAGVVHSRNSPETMSDWDRMMVEKAGELLAPALYNTLDQVKREVAAGVPLEIVYSYIPNYDKKKNILVLRLDNETSLALMERAKKLKAPMFSIVEDMLIKALV
jgi:ParB/RepB/Spo0J family partition protein